MLKDLQGLIEPLDSGYDGRVACSQLAARDWHLGSDNIQRSGGAARQVFQRIFSSRTKHGCPLRDDVFGDDLSIVGACHARIQMDLSVSGEHTRADKVDGLFQSATRCLGSPRKWTEMVAAQQYSISW